MAPSWVNWWHSRIGFKMFTLPPPPPPTQVHVASVFLPQPQRHPIKICGSASGDRENQQYYFGPVITKCRLQTGYKMHSASKLWGLATDLCINYHICTCNFHKHTSLFNIFRRSADMLLTSIKACLIIMFFAEGCLQVFAKDHLNLSF